MVLLKRTAALELGARYNMLWIDDAAVGFLIGPDQSAHEVRAWGTVANWHWSRNIRLSSLVMKMFQV